MNRKEKEIETRKRLMDATEEVFSRRGYTLATLDEIIALADTGKGTLYKYFGNKANLFYTLVSYKHRTLMEQMWAAAGGIGQSVEDRLTGILTVWIDFLRKNTVLWQVLCFEMTCCNREIAGYETETGEVRLTALWGDLPLPEEQENILRYHRLLTEEMQPITKVYVEGIRNDFFNDMSKHEDIARHMFFAVAMMVFFQTTNNLEKIPAEDLAKKIVKTRLYGLARHKEQN